MPSSSRETKKVTHFYDDFRLHVAIKVKKHLDSLFESKPASV